MIPDHGDTGAAIVSCGSYVLVSLLSAVLFFRTTRSQGSATRSCRAAGP